MSTAAELSDDLDTQTAEEIAAANARGDFTEDSQIPVAKTPEKTTEEKEAELEAAKAADAKAAEKVAKNSEVEETPEEKIEREKEEAANKAEADAKKRIRIPKERVDEMQRKSREREDALNKRIQDLERGATKTQQNEAVSELKTKAEKLQDEYEELLVDGKKVEAKAVRVQIEDIREKISDAKAAATSETARKTTIEELKYESTLSKIEADYPALNPDVGDQFDEAKAEEVADLMQGFMARGQARQVALMRAVKYVMGEPAAAAAVADKKEDAKPDTRAEDARRKAADAARKQPANSTKVGADSDKHGGGGKDKGEIDVMRLSQSKFNRLDEDTLSKLRGDEV